MVINRVNLNWASTSTLVMVQLMRKVEDYQPKVACDRRKKERKNCIGEGESQVALMFAKVVSGWIIESYQKPDS